MTLDDAKKSILAGLSSEAAAAVLSAIANVALDAERYRFLRDDAAVHPEACPSVFWANKHGEAGRRLAGANLDAEVDASRAAYRSLGYSAATSGAAHS